MNQRPTRAPTPPSNEKKRLANFLAMGERRCMKPLCNRRHFVYSTESRIVPGNSESSPHQRTVGRVWAWFWLTLAICFTSGVRLEAAGSSTKPVLLYSRYFNAEGETRYLPDGTFKEIL